jgi:AGCS family alanine or glycine:cation symporter
MTVLDFFNSLNYAFSIPGSLMLFGTTIFLTIYLRGVQFKGIKRFFQIIEEERTTQSTTTHLKTVNKFYALFNAMSTTLGMASIVGPSIAITVGGPGALFWLVAYALAGGIIKYTEVTLALHYRKSMPDGSVLGGPMQYLAGASSFIATWYTYLMVLLLASWSSLQANALGEMLAQVAIPEYVTGICLALFIFYILQGGQERAGIFNSKLIPVMCTLYLSSSLVILFLHADAIIPSLWLMMSSIFQPAAPIGAFVGAGMFTAFRSGVYKGALITESGLGTSSIPHSFAQTEKPSDQGILAMYSVIADTVICGMSGLLALITGVWQHGIISNALMYQVFELSFGAYGKFILISSLFMFILGTVLGNSLNGQQVFANITRYRYMVGYTCFISIVVFLGATSDVPLVWAVMETILPLVAVPHIMGLWYLAVKHKDLLRIS